MGLFFVFDFAFGVGENTNLANTAQSDVLRHSGPQTSASTIRHEGRKREAGRPARDVGKAEYCEANGRQVMRKCDRCRHRSSENAEHLAWNFGKVD